MAPSQVPRYDSTVQMISSHRSIYRDLKNNRLMGYIFLMIKCTASEGKNSILARNDNTIRDPSRFIWLWLIGLGQSNGFLQCQPLLPKGQTPVLRDWHESTLAKVGYSTDFIAVHTARLVRLKNELIIACESILNSRKMQIDLLAVQN